jgi:hypothetical protein
MPEETLDDIFGNDELNDALNEPEDKKDEKSEDEGTDDGGPDGEGKSKEDDPEGKESEETEDEVPPVINWRDDEELVESAPVNLAELTKKYPKLFNEFPGIRNSIVREEKFTEVFPTIELAQEAADRSEAFLNFQAELGSGQSKNLLQNIRQLNSRAFERFTENFLDNLSEVDGKQYNAVVGPVFQKLVKHVYKIGVKHKNEDLALAAQYFSDFLFDEKDPDKLREPERRKDDVESDERRRLQAERNTFLRERFESATHEVMHQVDTILVTEIKNGLDPNNRLSDFNRDALVSKIAEDIDKLLSKDERHNKTMRELWKRAERAGFSAEWRNKIRETYLNNARRILPQIRTKRKSEAFAGLKSGKVNTNNIPSGRAAQRGNSNTSKDKTPKRIDWNSTSDEDIFEGKAKLR